MGPSNLLAVVVSFCAKDKQLAISTLTTPVNDVSTPGISYCPVEPVQLLILICNTVF
jgi:hypothetical protein